MCIYCVVVTVCSFTVVKDKIIFCKLENASTELFSCNFHACYHLILKEDHRILKLFITHINAVAFHVDHLYLVSENSVVLSAFISHCFITIYENVSFGK